MGTCLWAKCWLAFHGSEYFKWTEEGAKSLPLNLTRAETSLQLEPHQCHLQCTRASDCQVNHWEDYSFEVFRFAIIETNTLLLLQAQFAKAAICGHSSHLSLLSSVRRCHSVTFSVLSLESSSGICWTVSWQLNHKVNDASARHWEYLPTPLCAA